MSWQDIKQAYAHLVDSLPRGEDAMREAWSDFSDTVRSHEDAPPYHLIFLYRIAKEKAADCPRAEVSILDHGCGGGLTLLFMAALGYTDIWGVNIIDDCEKWNDLCEKVLGLEGQRFFLYDGVTLPIESNTIDILVSQQVLEHVRDDVLESYYSEGARVLRDSGVALHSVPHRLVPYDSHSQSWIWHLFLPNSLWFKVLRGLGKSNSTVETALFLRWPWTHNRYLRQFFDDYEDLTLDRMTGLTNLDYYDGNMRLRRIVGSAARFPIIRSLIRNLVMIDTAATVRKTA